MSVSDMAHYANRRLLSEAPVVLDGPMLKDVFTDTPAVIIGCMIVSVLFSLATFGVIGLHIHALSATHDTSMVRTMYQKIVCLPLVFSACALASVFAVRAQFLFGLLKTFYEAEVLVSFGALLRGLLVFKFGNGPEAWDALAAAEPAAKLGAVFPLCCLRPWTKLTHLDHKKAKHVQLCTRQFCIFIIVKGVVELWITIDGSGEKFTNARQVLSIANFFSMVFAFNGLLVFYKGTHVVLSDYNITKKFIIIKATIFVFIVQQSIVNLILKKFGPPPNYDIDAYAAVLSSTLMCVECCLGSFLMRSAFPVSEVHLLKLKIPSMDMEMNSLPTDKIRSDEM